LAQRKAHVTKEEKAMGLASRSRRKGTQNLYGSNWLIYLLLRAYKAPFQIGGLVADSGFLVIAKALLSAWDSKLLIAIFIQEWDRSHTLWDLSHSVFSLIHYPFTTHTI
jgi:hypothetical protein